jgi:CRP-like cAMP-binding protein
VRTVVSGGDGINTEDTSTVEITPLLADLLLSTELMKGLTANQVAEFTSVCRQRRFARGELILREGDHDSFVYIMVDGLAQFTKNTSFGDGQTIMGELHSGMSLES